VIEKRQITPPLDHRIQQALAGNVVGTSAALLDLIQETETAAAVAEQKVADDRAKSLDPLTPFDEDAVQRLAADDIRAQRLRAACKPKGALAQRLSVLLADEAAADWDREHHRVEQLCNEAAEQLAEFPQLAAKMVAAFRKALHADAERSRLHGNAAPGEHRRIKSVEQIARGLDRGFDANLPSVIANTVLPNWQGGDALWPEKRESFATVIAPSFDPAFSSEWWKAGERERLAEQERREAEDEAAAIAKMEFYQGRP
jgi:hypothetical protein